MGRGTEFFVKAVRIWVCLWVQLRPTARASNVIPIDCVTVGTAACDS